MYAAVINKIEVGGVTVVSQNALVVSLGASFLERRASKNQWKCRNFMIFRI
jgi:hypothetical protein